METKRLLLPFTNTIDSCALENALRLAKGYNATLVPLALVHIPVEQQRKGARLEHIQQAKDFLEAVKHKATRYNVPIERLEVFTTNVVQSIDDVAQQMACEGILLFISGETGVLLRIDDIKHLIAMETHKLYLVRMPSNGNNNFMHSLHQRLSSLVPGNRKRQISRLEEQGGGEAESKQTIGEARQLVNR
jgi:hypothetical protein